VLQKTTKYLIGLVYWSS